jgi:formylglycine-generating enzyme required for sulfatase activity
MVLTVATHVATAQTPKTLGVRPLAGPYAGTTFYTNSHAVIIGIHEYQHLPREKWLPFADKDAEDLRNLLIRSYGFAPENVTLLINSDATKYRIEAALTALTDHKRVGKDDRCLVYFSGHGQTVPLPDGGEKGFLVPYDADVNLSALDDPVPFLTTCIQMSTVWEKLQFTQAKHNLLIADACFAGTLIVPKLLGGEPPNSIVVSQDLERRAMQGLTAGTRDEEALIFPELGHSVMTRKLLDELRAQAGAPNTVFFASQLAAGIKTPVANYVAEQTAGKRHQTPQFGSFGPNEGDFIFVTTPPQQVPSIAVTRVDRPVVQPARKEESPTPAERSRIWAGGGGHAARLVNRKDGAEMIYIPAGPFLMGDDDVDIKDFQTMSRNHPRHTVTLSGYYIYKNLVTVRQYKAYIAANPGKTMPQAPSFDPIWSQDDHPMVNVTWQEAMDYAKWTGCTLPSEAQWERAARGTDGRKYPWGDEFDATKAWCSKAAVGDAGGTAAGGFYGVSPSGCTDMAGNVWQWCRDWYDANFWTGRAAGQTDPENQGVGAQQYRVLRGGCWNDFNPLSFCSAFRFFNDPAVRFNFVGFRCMWPEDYH